MGYLPAGKDVSRRHCFSFQEMTGEDIEDFMCAAVTVIFRVCKTSEAVIVTCSYDL
jgi:hypothetical protein